MNFYKIIVLLSLVLVGCIGDKPPVAVAVPVVKQVTKPSETDSKSNSKSKDERMSWQKPDQVIQSLGHLDDKVVADLGAGIGYFSFKLVPKSKKVIAIDIDPETTQILEAFKGTLRDDLKDRFDIRLATANDSKLNDEEIDILLIVNTIVFLTPRVDYLAKVKNSLKVGGKIFIVDFKTKKMPDYVNAPPYDYRLYSHILEEQLETAGYSNISIDDTSLEYQYMVTAYK